MRFRTVLSLATFLMACFTLAVWSSPLPAQPAPGIPPSDPQAVSGKISSIGDAAFTLDVPKNGGSDANTLQFLVDEDTKVDGRLSVGAFARVEYRSNGGQYVATHIAVKPATKGSY